MSILEKAPSHKPPMGIYEHSLFSHLSILFFHTIGQHTKHSGQKDRCATVDHILF